MIVKIVKVRLMGEGQLSGELCYVAVIYLAISLKTGRSEDFRFNFGGLNFLMYDDIYLSDNDVH